MSCQSARRSIGGRPERVPGVRVDPCAFRVAVARAWEDHRAGRRVGLVGFDANDTAEPLTVTWRVDPPGRLIGLGAVRARYATHMVWAFASVLPPDRLTTMLADVNASDAPPPATGDGLTARLIHDELLEATVVHIEAGPADPADPATGSIVRALDEVMRRMLAVVGATEIVDAIAADQL